MTGTRAASAIDEQVAFVPAGDGDVFVILTRPPAAARRVAVFILAGGGRRGQGGTPSFGRNRISVRLARSLAGDGYHVVRLDYPGVGESSGGPARFDLRHPFTPETLAVARWLLATSEVDRIVFCGGCFGGRAGLAAAAQLPETSGVALWGSPVRDLQWGGGRLATLPARSVARKAVGRKAIAGWRDPRRRRLYVRLLGDHARRLLKRRTVDDADRAASATISPRVERQLRALTERGVPVVFLYGEDDEFLADYRQAVAERREVLRGDDDLVRLEVVGGKVHGLSTVASQVDAETSTRRLLARLG